MIDFDNIRKVVVAGLKGYLNVPVIRSNQTGKPPEYPYVSYTITTPMSQNKGTYGRYDDNKERKPFTQTWSITVQSDDNSECVELAIKAHEWLDYVGRVHLTDNGVVVQQVGGVNNRDNLLTIEYEYRNGFDVIFGIMNEVDDTTYLSGTIESIEFDSKLR